MLLDELAAGTDPVEGAALAQALLERLAGQARLTIATSHYHELKEWASASDDASNAATGFDPETEEPLYRIALGRPGTSHALRIAAAPRPSVRADRGRRPPYRTGASTRHGAPGRGRGRRGARSRGARARGERSVRRRRRHAGRRGAGSRARGGDRAGARVRRARSASAALADAERELAETRAELDGAPRRDPRRAPARTRATSGVDAASRREGAGARPAARRSVRARRARGALARAADEPLDANRPARRRRSRSSRLRSASAGRSPRSCVTRLSSLGGAAFASGPARAAPPRSRRADRGSGRACRHPTQPDADRRPVGARRARAHGAGVPRGGSRVRRHCGPRRA